MVLPQEHLGTILAVMSGIGLSAACGFRIFVPLLVLNLASMCGLIHVAQGFEWMAGYYATIAFALATALEIAAYYIPWLDNVLDAIASPVSIIAGTILTASVITDMPTSVRWIVAIIAGGGIAGLLQGSTVALRAKSSLFTGGLGNIIIATLELIGSMVASILAVILPVIGFALVLAFAIYVLVRVRRRVLRKRGDSRDGKGRNNTFSPDNRRG